MSCDTCTDTPLSKAASIIGIFTFAYAVLTGIVVFGARVSQISLDSPHELRELADSLVISFGEFESATRLLKTVLDEEDSGRAESDDLKIQAVHILNRSKTGFSNCNPGSENVSTTIIPRKRVPYIDWA
jgi:hypothetical protein